MNIALYEALRGKVREKLRGFDRCDDQTVLDLTSQTIRQEMQEKDYVHHPSLREKAALGRRIFNSICRMDILTPLLEDDRVTDIMVNGHEKIFYEKDGAPARLCEHFESEARLEDLIQQIVGQVNRTVNEASPIVDARLPDGSRVNVVLPPASLSGAVLTIRKFREDPITMEDLLLNGTSTEKTAAFLEKAVADRRSLFVCGGTASGKTTLLNVLSNYIPEMERVITIEDSAELRILRPKNIVSLETRAPNVEGRGAITLRDLIRTSLRMNPDRLIVGEVRGAETFDLLSGMNTGHACMSTGHANSCKDMLRRMESMVWMGADIPLEAIRLQIASALDYLVYVQKMPDGRRRIREIVEVGEVSSGEISLRQVMVRHEDEQETEAWF